MVITCATMQGYTAISSIHSSHHSFSYQFSFGFFQHSRYFFYCLDGDIIISLILSNNCFLCHNDANILIIGRLVKFPAEVHTELRLDKRYLPARETGAIVAEQDVVPAVPYQ